MNWFIELMQLIDELTGIGENYSFLTAGAVVILIAMAAIAVIAKLFRNI